MKNTVFYIMNSVVLIIVIVVDITFYNATGWLTFLAKWIGIAWMTSGVAMMIILVVSIKKHNAEENI